MRKRKSVVVLPKIYYQKIIDILKKITKNKKVDIGDVGDEEYLVKQQVALSREYSNERLESQQKSKPIAFKGNRSQNEVEQESKRIRVCN